MKKASNALGFTQAQQSLFITPFTCFYLKRHGLLKYKFFKRPCLYLVKKSKQTSRFFLIAAFLLFLFYSVRIR